MATKDLKSSFSQDGIMANGSPEDDAPQTKQDTAEELQEASPPPPRYCPKCGRELVFYEGHDWCRCPAPCNAWHRFYHCLECEDSGFRYIIKFHQERGEPFLFVCECDCQPPRPTNLTIIESNTSRNKKKGDKVRIPVRFSEAPNECKFLAEYQQYLKDNPRTGFSHSLWLALIHYPQLHEQWYRRAYSKKYNHKHKTIGTRRISMMRIVHFEGTQSN